MGGTTGSQNLKPSKPHASTVTCVTSKESSIYWTQSQHLSSLSTCSLFCATYAHISEKIENLRSWIRKRPILQRLFPRTMTFNPIQSPLRTMLRLQTRRMSHVYATRLTCVSENAMLIMDNTTDDCEPISQSHRNGFSVDWHVDPSFSPLSRS